MRPQLKTTNFEELSRYCLDSETLERNLKWLSWRTYTPWKNNAFAVLWNIVFFFKSNLVIGAEVVDLLAEYGHPEILADELHEVELILKLRRLLRQLFDEAVAGVEPDELEVGERPLPLLGVRLLKDLSDKLQVQQLEWDLFGHGQVLERVNDPADET